MKKVLFFALCLLLNIGYTLPTMAQDSDDADPPVTPNATMAAVMQTADSDVQVVFLENADFAEVAIVKSSNGSCAYEASGTVVRNQQVVIPKNQLPVGKHTVQVKMNGRIVKQVQIEIK